MTHRPCPICERDRSSLALLDHGQPVVCCRGCGLLYANPVPEASDLRDYYDEAYADTAAWAQTFGHDRALVFSEGLKRIRSLQPTGKLLDVGCSLGLFLDGARTAGYATCGVEPSKPAAQYARETLQLDVRTGTLAECAESLGEQCFSIATLWDVLEHLPHPRRDLELLRRLLGPGGLLVVRVPNVNFHLTRLRLVRSLRGRDPKGLDSRNHLNHFSPTTLRELLEATGFRILNLVPGPPNVYGNRSDLTKLAYHAIARWLYAASGWNVGTIMEAYARRSAAD